MMDEYELLQTSILSFFTIFWLTLIGSSLGCSKKKKGPVKKVGNSAASVLPVANVKPQPNPANVKAAPDPKSPVPAGDGKDDNKEDKKEDKKPDEKPEDKGKSEKKEEEKQVDDKKEDDKKPSKKEGEKKKEASNNEDKKKIEKPKEGDKKEGGSGDKQSVKPELSTNRTQLSKSVKVKDDDDTVKHIESLKEDKGNSE